jgi:YVTN family beta-propeller protein
MPRASVVALAALVAFASATVAAHAAPASAHPGTLLVLNKSEATVSLIDLGTGATTATVTTGRGPHEAAVSPDGRLAVVTNYGTGQEPGSTLTVIDVPDARVVRTIDLDKHRRPHGVAWLPGGRTVAVTAEDSRALLLVDVKSGRVEAAIGTDQDVSHMVVLSADGRRAYVANIGSGSVSVLDLKKRALVKVVPTAAGAEGIALSPDGRTLWVTNREADSVSIIDTTALEVVATAASAAFPIRAAATADARHVLVSNARSGDLTIFDAATRKEARRVPMDLAAADTDGRLFGGRFGGSPVPIGIQIPPGSRRAYVANANADAIAVVDLEAWKVVGLLRAGREPDGMAWSPHAVATR